MRVLSTRQFGLSSFMFIFFVKRVANADENVSAGLLIIDRSSDGILPFFMNLIWQNCHIWILKSVISEFTEIALSM